MIWCLITYKGWYAKKKKKKPNQPTNQPTKYSLPIISFFLSLSFAFFVFLSSFFPVLLYFSFSSFSLLFSSFLFLFIFTFLLFFMLSSLFLTIFFFLSFHLFIWLSILSFPFFFSFSSFFPHEDYRAINIASLNINDTDMRANNSTNNNVLFIFLHFYI